MSRLYAWINSDTRKTELTTEGNERIDLQVNYGSKDNSKYLCELIVAWKKGDVVPTVSFAVASEAELKTSKVY